jgi:hypothetical protein
MAKYETVASFVQAVKAIDFGNLNAFDQLQALLPDTSIEVRRWVDHTEKGSLMAKIESALREGHITSAKEYQKNLMA